LKREILPEMRQHKLCHLAELAACQPMCWLRLRDGDRGGRVPPEKVHSEQLSCRCGIEFARSSLPLRQFPPQRETDLAQQWILEAHAPDQGWMGRNITPQFLGGATEQFLAHMKMQRLEGP